MNCDYRTLVWGVGAGIFSVIVFAQIATWFNIGWETGKWITIVITLCGMLTGFILDQYYKKKEEKEEKKKIRKRENE